MLYDALFLSSDELMSKLKGRKVLIILTDGVDSGSRESLLSSLEAAQRADAVVYAIYFKGRDKEPNPDRGFHVGNPNDDCNSGGYPGGGYPGGYPGGGYPGGGGCPAGQKRQQDVSAPDGRKVLERMADETGGRLFEMSKKDSLADIYKYIAEELRAQYRLTFAADDKTGSDGYHRIVLDLSKVNPKDFYVQTRDGYYGSE